MSDELGAQQENVAQATPHLLLRQGSRAVPQRRGKKACEPLQLNAECAAPDRR